MDKHLGEFKTPVDKAKTNMVFYRIKNLFFQFQNYEVEIDYGSINSLSLTANNNIIIQLALFDANLYNAYVFKDNILSITEKGTYFDVLNREEEIEYETSYKNYRIKSVSGTKGGNDNAWTFVLEKIDE